MGESKCSIMINSCDKYEDAWFPFFELIKKYWQGCNYEFYLNTETKSYIHSGLKLTVLNEFNSDAKLAWGERTKDCLNRIETPYVILMLEDFFLHKDVDEEELLRCIDMLNNNSNIVAIYFKRIAGFRTDCEFNNKYYNMVEKKDCRLNLQAGLWRREELIKLIDNEDSPWTFEEEGYRRVANNDAIFLCSKRGTHINCNHCVFPYLTDRRLGYGIWAGKWLWKNEELFKKNGIQIAQVHMERFTRLDLIKYYIKRLKQKLSR